jgi:hypothetical protein
MLVAARQYRVSARGALLEARQLADLLGVEYAQDDVSASSAEVLPATTARSGSTFGSLVNELANETARSEVMVCMACDSASARPWGSIVSAPWEVHSRLRHTFAVSLLAGLLITDSELIQAFSDYRFARQPSVVRWWSHAATFDDVYFGVRRDFAVHGHAEHFGLKFYDGCAASSRSSVELYERLWTVPAGRDAVEVETGEWHDWDLAGKKSDVG